MYRERRTISLVILTLFIYASNIYFEFNSFVLPFPIFDLILIVIALQFAFWNRKDLITYRKWYFYIYFLALAFKLLMNPILWGFFLDEISMENFLDSTYLEYFKIFYTLLSIAVFICWSVVEKLKLRFLFVGMISIVQLFGLFEFSYPGMYLAYSFFTGYVLIQKPTNSLSYILLLHAILDLMTLSILIFIR
ncbi:MAG: hypothetical protein FJZ67_08980 [Bacteroidetes bacterium]|nr:hypothetical protein [Bacteroidota bacterium]